MIFIEVIFTVNIGEFGWGTVTGYQLQPSAMLGLL